MVDDLPNINIARELVGYFLVVLLSTAPWIVLAYYGTLYSFLVAIAVCVIWRLLAGGLYHQRFAAAGCGWVVVVPLATLAILVDVGLLVAYLFGLVS